MKPYNGTTDLEKYVAQYQERMEIIPILVHLKEACLCKGFGSTLMGSALKWLLNVPLYSITSFAHLVNIFNNQFSFRRIFEKITSDLYRVVQDPKERLRDFVYRFGREALSIPKIKMTTAVEAFNIGLRKDSPFYEDLVMTPLKRLDEVRCRALRFIRLEEDKEIQKRCNCSSRSLGRPNPRPQDPTSIIHAMQDLRDKARWPKKDNKSTSWKDKSKWHAYHEDFDHKTEDFNALRKEIIYLLNKGHRKEILGRKREKIREEQP
ncbi:hypothetical protein Lser_V15G13261 [Lactuca serriola]